MYTAVQIIFFLQPNLYDVQKENACLECYNKQNHFKQLDIIFF